MPILHAELGKQGRTQLVGDVMERFSPDDCDLTLEEVKVKDIKQLLEAHKSLSHFVVVEVDSVVGDGLGWTGYLMKFFA